MRLADNFMKEWDAVPMGPNLTEIWDDMVRELIEAHGVDAARETLIEVERRRSTRALL